jgi:hypothetical protein
VGSLSSFWKPPKHPDRLGSQQILLYGGKGAFSFMGIKVLEREANHSLPYSDEGKN